MIVWISNFTLSKMPITNDKDAKSKINKKNLGKIALNKSLVWFWSKYLNIIGAITDDGIWTPLHRKEVSSTSGFI